MSEYFYWCGVLINAVGSFGVLGAALWLGCEAWVKFRHIRGPLMDFYAAKLKERRAALAKSRETE